ncbi:MAG: hypothetical protein RLZZ303_1159, partial [Candidatus Hydrogenedentota bacterium]
MTQRYVLLAGLVFSALTLAGAAIRGDHPPASSHTLAPVAPASVDLDTEDTGRMQLAALTSQPALAAAATQQSLAQGVNCGQYTFDVFEATYGTEDIFINAGGEVTFRVRVFDAGGNEVLPGPGQVMLQSFVLPDAPGEVIGLDDDGLPLIPDEGPFNVTQTFTRTYPDPGVYQIGFRVRVAGEAGFCPDRPNVGLPFIATQVVNVLEEGGEATTADIAINDAVRDGTGLVPANDWVPLLGITLSFTPDAPAPRVLSRLVFELIGSGISPQDILEFGIFRDRGDIGGGPDGAFRPFDYSFGGEIPPDQDP